MRILASVLTVAVLIFGGSVYAHSMIKDVNISSGDTSAQSPETFDITFSHKAALADVELESSSGDAIEIVLRGVMK